MNSISTLKEEIDLICSTVVNSPEGRLNLRKKFYLKYGFSKLAKYGYGQSEIDFIEWEIKRGVLNDVNDIHKKGSVWWRKMNMQIIHDSEFARLLFETKSNCKSISESVKNWLNYLNKPDSKSWYQAHNGSIINACFQFSKEIEIESHYEKIFIKDVLMRVLFAQAMVEGKEFAFGKLGKILANPILPAVKIITRRQKLYPISYPLTQENYSSNEVFLEHHIRTFVNKYVIDKNEKKLFQFAAELIGITERTEFIMYWMSIINQESVARL